MTKIRFLFVFAVIVFATSFAQLAAQVSTWDGTHTPWTHGTGTEDDPFLIESAQQLAYLTYRVNNGLDAVGGHTSNAYHYKLMTDIDLNGSEDFQWTPIGYYTSSTDYQCFGGSFDGNGHSVSGVYVNTSTLSCVGFFGYTNNATVKNLAVSGTSVITSHSLSLGYYNIISCAGGIIGLAAGSICIINCRSYFSGNISSVNYVGGIVGYLSSTSGSEINESSIINCCNTGHVRCTSYEGSLGGIVGYAQCTISNCYNTGIVTCSYDDNTNGTVECGGIVGHYGSGRIFNCYNTGSVGEYMRKSTYKRYGGIAGCARGTITYCYNTGAVYNGSNGASYSGSGGIVGYIDDDVNVVNNSYYLNTCGGYNTYGGFPMSADAMRSEDFLGMLADGSCAWAMDTQPYTNDGYPILTMIQAETYTYDATSVTQTHSTLNGGIFVINDEIVSAGFMYKQSDANNFTKITVNNYADIMTYTLSGLIPSTSYTYKTYLLTAGCDTTFGVEKTFTTLPISVTTNAATNITESSAQLNAQMQIGDATLINKGFKYIKQGETDSTTIIVEGEDFIAQLYGLDVNTIYRFCAFVNIAESDMTYYGSTRTFETSWLNADTIPIYDTEMLQWVSDKCNSGTTFAGKYIKLMNNIVLPLNQPNNMTSIGSYPDHPFMGTFDGNGKLITNLYIDQPNTPYQGFFGYTLNANLYNVGLVNITASGRNYTGGMVAYAENTNMRDCYVNGGSLFALSYCGGLVGYQTPGTNSIISGCYNTCTVSGNHYVGGLLGYSDYGTVRNSYVAASVAAQGEAVGSIIGGANEVLMYQCYFSSEITGQENAIGENNFKSNEGMTNEQMRDPQFVETLNQGLTVPVWKSDYEQPINSGFPILKWQYSEIETCGAPENLTSIKNGNNITLIWTGEENVDYYIVEYGLAGEQAQTETTTRNTISFNYEQLGSYYWRVKSVCPFGESNFVNGENVVIGGIEEIGGIQQIGIYPNPASESVTIQSEGQNDLEQINVFDVNGRMVMSESATGQIHRLDISNLQQGIYFVKVQTSDGYMTNKKLIVQ
ncbi:MAG: T9SS type A sorting domain-containing protein [Bacteroidales bacterium]|nr:T9SS type A sorting domain-containing protein [Bacteroidales bacterium]